MPWLFHFLNPSSAGIVSVVIVCVRSGMHSSRNLLIAHFRNTHLEQEVRVGAFFLTGKDQAITDAYFYNASKP